MQIINIVQEDKDVQVTEEVKAHRLSVCGSCEYNMNQYCGKCFCILDVITNLKDKSCPEGKWDVSLL